MLRERLLHESWSAIENHWVWIRGSEQKAFTLELRLYSGAELADQFTEAGFSGVKLYGSFAGTPYDQKAERLVAVATK